MTFRWKSMAAAVAICAMHGSVSAQWYDVTVYGATPDDPSDDDAPAFREAYQRACDNPIYPASGRSQGGTVYVPAGAYHFTSQDSSVLAADAHVVLGDSAPAGHGDGVTFRGDAAAYAGGLWQDGSVIVSMDPGLGVFAIVGSDLGISQSHAIGFRDLKITRDTQDIQGALPYTACGIRYARVGGQTSVRWPRDNRISNVIFSNHYNGVRTEGTVSGTAGDGVGPFNMIITQSVFYNSEDDGLHMDGWNELIISDSLFYGNGASGAYIGSVDEGRLLSGTLKIANSSFHDNAIDGLFMYGTGIQLVDSHIVSSQFDSNDVNGASCTLVRNLNIAGCSFTSNGSVVNGTVFGNGLYLDDAQVVSIAGCSFQSNGNAGAVFRDCEGLALSGAAFVTNNNPNPAALPSGGVSHTSYALTIIGGSALSIGNIVFDGQHTTTTTGGTFDWGDQRFGIWLQDNPVGLNISGVTFKDWVHASQSGVMLHGANLSTSFGQVEFIKSGNWTINGVSQTINTCRIKVLLPDDVSNFSYGDPG